MPKLLLRSFTTILSITSTTLAQKLSSTMGLLSVTAKQKKLVQTF